MQFEKDVNRISLNSIPKQYTTYCSILGLCIFSYVIRAVRWRKYLQELGYNLPKFYSVLTYVAGFAFTLAPGKIGELIKVRYYKDYKIPIIFLIGGYFVERIFDFVVILCFALIFADFAMHTYTSLFFLLVTSVICTWFLFGIFRNNYFFNALLNFSWFKCKIIRNLVLNSLDAFSAVKKLLTFRMLIVGFVLGFLGWFCEISSLYILSSIIASTSLSFPDAIGIYAISILVGAISFMPGGLGTTEATMIALLVHHNYSIGDAILLTTICRFLTLWVAVFLGLLAVTALKLIHCNE